MHSAAADPGQAGALHRQALALAESLAMRPLAAHCARPEKRARRRAEAGGLQLRHAG